MKTGSARISKAQWYGLGGFANPNLWRRQVRGAWQYFKTI